VGTRLAYLLAPGETLSEPPGERTPLHPSSLITTPSPQTPDIKAETPRHGARALPAISPRAARVARELRVDWTRLQGSGRTGRIVERDVRQAVSTPVVEGLPAEVRASPVARRAAQELGVDLAQLAARLPGKRIERADVEAAAQKTAPAAAAPTAPVHEIPLPEGPRGVPVSQVRRMTAERMAFSAHTATPVTLTTEADATELVRLRQQLKEDGAALVPSYNDLLAKLVAQALLEHPQLNAHFEGESIVQSAAVNIGLAVDTERGLLAPVLRDVQSKSLLEIAQESADLIEKARSGRISLDDLRGGTFTLTNLGMFEIDAFTPIINLPECAVLGAGRIIPKQVVVDAEAERVAIRQMMFLSLTFDHRLVDGAPAARFLQRVKQYVEKPFLWLVEGGRASHPDLGGRASHPDLGGRR
jgi:pyruvate dehydrogenase E2 component (dihydrolipoamide acetyltransferase)